MIAGVLLAAGGARRFGSQKLVAPFGGMPVVRRAALALAPHVGQMVIVVGSDAEAVRSALAGVDARIIDNPSWNDGLSSSLRCGIAALSPNADAAVIALGDQPAIDAAIFMQLTARWAERSTPIVAARFRGVVSPPVLLDRAVFADVATLEGDVGARPLIERHSGRVAFVEIDDDPPHDVDTVADLRALEQS